MKKARKYLIPVLGLMWISLHFGCRTLSTTAGSPPSGPVNGILYYLPIGKITIKGEFKDVSPTEAPPSRARTGTPSGDATNVIAESTSPSISPATPGGDGGSQPPAGSTTVSAGQLTITLTPEVEADESAGEYYVTPHANYVYEDETRVTVNSKQLLSTGNVTTEDKTADIVGALASIASKAMTFKGVPLKKEKAKSRLPFYFSLHPSNYLEYKNVKDRLNDRGITFKLDPEPSPNGKRVAVSAPEAKQLGGQGLLFRPATSYKVTLGFKAADPKDESKSEIHVIDSTQQFILPDPNRLYEIEYPRMAFVKKMKEVGFTNGMLTDFHQKVPSPILGFLGIPKAALQAIVPIPGAGGPSGSASGSGTAPPKS
jgi:hypothetical protein